MGSFFRLCLCLCRVCSHLLMLMLCLCLCYAYALVRTSLNRAILPNNLKSWQVYFIIIDRTINLRFIAKTSILESRTNTLRSSKCASKLLIFNAAITKPRPNGLIVDGLPLLLAYLRFIRGGNDSSVSQSAIL